jgi:hypothetical protein
MHPPGVSKPLSASARQPLPPLTPPPGKQQHHPRLSLRLDLDGLAVVAAFGRLLARGQETLDEELPGVYDTKSDHGLARMANGQKKVIPRGRAVRAVLPALSPGPKSIYTGCTQTIVVCRTRSFEMLT